MRTNSGGAIAPTATSLEQANTNITRLASRKDAWLQVGITDRISYLQQCIHDVMAIASTWAEAACLAKGIDPDSALAGEEWLVGPTTTIATLQQLITTLKAKGTPKVKKKTTRQGQTVAQIFPGNLAEQLLWLGFTGELWIEPGQPATQGKIYRERPQSGQVCLVLGAGNISSIAPLDTLYKLFAEDSVVLLKMNPVNAYMGPILEQAFQALRQDGFLEVVYGGAELGSALCQHELIDRIHITGSHHTYDAIVWGSTPEEQTQRKADYQPLNLKPITAELGCVTPILVVPGSWSESDLAYHARHLAGMVAHNASFNCAAAKVVVTAKDWPQRSQFLEYLNQALIDTPARMAYYPGARERYYKFLERYPQALPVNSGSDNIIPWTLIPEVPAQADEYALTHEAFCGVLAEVSLDVADPGEFLAQAVEFVNEQVWGNLSCSVLIHPTTQRQFAKAMNRAIADLRYGAIGINVWSAVAYILPVFPWGAFPGNPKDDISSGQGVVHNAALFDYPQKAVLRAPFRIAPIPTWFPGHQTLLEVAQRMTDFYAKPSLSKFFNLIWAAIRG